MKIPEFDRWCAEATGKIRFLPDRERVSRELRSHLQDSREHFLDLGRTPEDAARLALEAMGRPDAIAEDLAALHHPFWGWCSSVTKWIFIVLALIAALSAANWLGRLGTEVFLGDALHTAIDPEAEVTTDAYGTWTRMRYAEPNATDRSDGYTLKLTQAEEAVDETGAMRLRAVVEVSTLSPWLVSYDAGINSFEARDSLGNHYDSELTVFVFDSGLFLDRCELTLWDYRSRDAEWIEFYYDRGGRDIVLRVDLTGGGAS